ncbi:MAG: ABC transporter permease [Clostridiales bacterium]|nr:ABC transporter permease [Clostridiales bacterium]
MISLIQAAVVFGTVIMFGCMGEILTEKSGNLNLGVPGIMYLGGIASLAGTFLYEKNVENPSRIICVLIALVCGFAAATLGGLLYSFLTISLRTNQNVTGLTLTIFGSGVANFFGGSLNKLAGGVGQISVAETSAGFRQKIPFLSTDTGAFGEIFFAYGFMVYLAIIIAVIMQIFFNKSKTGLNLRAVGENPATADAAGINVIKYKYLSTCIGAGITGLGGVYYVMDYIKGTWANDANIENLGWLAVALVIFATWKSKNAIWGAYLFGVLYWMYQYIPSNMYGFIPGGARAAQEIFKMLPYVVTIFVLVITSLKKSKENRGPASLGLSYFREER